MARFNSTRESAQLLPTVPPRVSSSFRARATRPAAAFACAQWNGCLVAIASQLENDAVATLIPPAGTSWLGLEQAPNAPTPNDGWSWCDGTPLAFSKWLPAKPDGGELCVFEDAGGLWDDAPCNSTYSAFVCERPL